MIIWLVFREKNERKLQTCLAIIFENRFIKNKKKLIIKNYFLFSILKSRKYNVLK